MNFNSRFFIDTFAQVTKIGLLDRGGKVITLPMEPYGKRKIVNEYYKCYLLYPELLKCANSASICS